MKLLESVKHQLCAVSLLFLFLQYIQGNSQSAFQWNLSCYNQSWLVQDINVSTPDSRADPVYSPRLCMNQRCCCCGCLPHGDDLGDGPYVRDAAVDSLIDSLPVEKPHLQFSGCLTASSLQYTAVQVYSEKQAYATGTDVTFLAVTEEQHPLEFFWQFGDVEPVRTSSRTFIKKFLLPDRYNVSVHMSNGLYTVSSKFYAVVIQTAVQPNRLLYTPSVLLDTSVQISCRINAGTNVSYLWDFGDGSQRVGHSTESHVFKRTGEFTVGVTVFNLVSSAFLKGLVFVVSEPCQPPPVKNMGPSRIQVWRDQLVSLGVTFDSQIQCNISRGILYSWTLYKPNGQQLQIPLIYTNRQNLELPKYLLHYGTYTAIAKVQVVGSIVYSNYSVLIEVMSSLPVSVISGGTKVFISRDNKNNITLDGHKSYDPDFPHNVMRYSWKCRPVNSAESSCFRQNVLDSSALITFPAHVLQPDCDLFKFTLTVHSANRSSSSEVFVTVRSKPTSVIYVSCKECRGNSVSWNEQFSVTAVCENCPTAVTYYWTLYLVNTSSKTGPEALFCGSVDHLPSKMEEDTLSHFANLSSQSFHNTTALFPLSVTNTHNNSVNRVSELTTTSTSLLLLPKPQPSAGVTKSHKIQSRSERSSEHFEGPWAHFDLLSGSESASASEASGAFSEDDFSPYFNNVDFPDENISENNVGSEYSIIHEDLDYEYFHAGIEEADAGEPVGRPAGPHRLDDLIPVEREGDNLVDPSSVGHVVSEKTLLDLDKELIQPALLHSYTLTGISSSVIMFKPSVLKPKSLYMLEVSTSVDQALQGKAQLFFHTHSSPEGMSCHVQPSTGQEIRTHFSIFCTSGKHDLVYNYSFSVGNSAKKCLYEGRDYQHYFNLPAGDPHNNYEVTVYTEIRNRFGSTTKPCPVTVTVLPSFQRNASSNPDQDLLLYGLGNLTSLISIRNNRDIINYISLLTVVLNRLSLDSESSADLQTYTRTSLISTVCQLTITKQDSRLEILHILSDLLKIANQVMFDSAKLVTKYTQHISSLHEPGLPVGHILDVNVVKAVFVVLSHVLEAEVPPSRPGIQLTQTVLHVITDSVLIYMQSSKDLQYSVNSTVMELMAWQHYSSSPTVKTINMTTFYIPDMLDVQIKQGRNKIKEQSLCFITQLISYKQNPYHWTRTPVQLSGDVAEMKLFNCSTRREISRRYLSTPVIIEFQKRENINESLSTKFTLHRSEVNTHMFNITPELLHTALQLRVDFSRPVQHTFPIMLLFRMHKRPTPVLYNMQNVYRWTGQTAQIFLPPSFLKDAGKAYLMLLNADYNKSPVNKYTANAVNYTLSIESLQCLAWDGLREWRPDSCSVLRSYNSRRINCSCRHLTSFTVTHQFIYSTYNRTNITEYMSIRFSWISCFLIALSVAVYAVLLVFCKNADVCVEKSSGAFLLPDNNPLDQFLYAVTIHTGLRSTARMTAKVYIILFGDDGVSQTRELSSSDHKLFTSNSTNTFILSAPCSLGRVRQVYLWHDSSGSSPSWFLSHVLVKDLLQGSSWMFLAQCWLAVDEGDGRVERRLQALEQKLTFRELLYLKLMECFKDFHPWLSVYTRPSYSTHTHTQRLSVCLLLLQAYMCANAVLIHLQEEQYLSELGLIGVSAASVLTGLCALVLMPLGSLISCLFRISKPIKSRSGSGDQYKVRLPYVYSVEDHHDALLLKARETEPNHLWTTASPWTQTTEKPEPDIHNWKDSCDSGCSKLTDASKLQRTTDSTSCIEIIEENIHEDNKKFQQGANFKCSHFSLLSNSSEDSLKKHPSSITVKMWCYYITWTFWLCLCLTFMTITGILGLKFSSTKSLLWIQSVYFSLLFCVFAVHPVMILITVICVTLRCGERGSFNQRSDFIKPLTALLKTIKHRGVTFNKFLTSSSNRQPEDISIHSEKVLAARKRARYLRLARPPTSAELKPVRHRIRKTSLVQKTMRELVLCLIILSTAGFVAYGKIFKNTFHLNQAVKARFTRPLNIQNPDTWWNWTEKTLLDGLYQQDTSYNKIKDNVNTAQGTFFHIGEPVITKMEHTNSSHQVFRFSSLFNRPHLCGKFECYEEAGNFIHLGRSRSEVSSAFQKLSTAGWMDKNTKAMIVHFTLYSPPYNLFTTVTMLSEWSPVGAFQTSLFVYSTRLYNSATALDYWLMAAELFFLLITLLQLYYQICVVAERGWFYWINLWNWLQVMILLISFLSFICAAHHFKLRADVIEHLQRVHFKTFVDVSPVSSWEQLSRLLYGILVLLLLIKSCCVLRVNETMATAVSTMALIFSNLFWPLIAAAILITALSCLVNLFFHSNSSVFCSFPRSVYWIISHCFSAGKLRSFYERDHKSQPSLALCFYGALLCCVTFALKAMITGGLISSVKTAAKSKRRNPYISVTDLVTYSRDVSLAFIGKGRQNWTDNTNNLYLEEFEDLVDELLLRLSEISDSDAYEEKENVVGQRCLSSASDYSSEAVEMENILIPVELSCVQSIPSYTYDEHKESRLRSLLEWKPLQAFEGSRDMIYDRPISPDQKSLKTITAVPKKKSKNSQIFLCSDQTVSIQIECSDTSDLSRSHCFTVASVKSETFLEKQTVNISVNIPGQCF